MLARVAFASLASSSLLKKVFGLLSAISSKNDTGFDVGVVVYSGVRNANGTSVRNAC